nr:MULTISPECIES: hypothetical protein [Roseovarius]
MQTWFSGLRRPDQAYQGEKTEPMKAMIEMARPPPSFRPSTYHHA